MLSEAEKRLHRCAFTGHRPEKLHRSEEAVKAALEKEIRHAIADGLSVFISGMARSVDIWAAEIVLHMRDAGQPINLICASPYNGVERGWKENWRQQYCSVMARADLVRFISPRYSQACFHIRNEWMINHSARVIAVFNGEQGGTKNTLDYADKMGVQIIMIDG